MDETRATADGGIDVLGARQERYDEVLTLDALAFVAGLQREFGPRRRQLLDKRRARVRELAAGGTLSFLPETQQVRDDTSWRVPPAPADLADRRCEITGPTEAKMLINALNSGATTFMADFEDSNAPTWDNLVRGQLNLTDAIERRLQFSSGEKEYRLAGTVATLIIRPRGWHLDERHLTVDGQPVSGSLFDFGLYVFHNAQRLLDRGSGPYFYLPKMESHHEAALWNDVFTSAENSLGLPVGTIRATVLIETLPAAFEIEEILHALGPHASGCNAGRWDYIFSMIKTFRTRPKEFLLPDRNTVTMTVPFMRAYTELLVSTCHRRGAHAIGGMAGFIPSRRDKEVNDTAMAKVRDDKEREARDGFDGSWVAHPDLVPICTEVFSSVLGDRPNQLDVLRDDVHVTAGQLLDARSAPGEPTAEGLRNDVSVGLQYIAAWLGGNGAVGIFNLMEDAATAEIARSQVWQWLQAGVFDESEVREVIESVAASLAGQVAEGARLDEARQLFESLVFDDTLADFLTLGAYAKLD